jgi:glycine hydroxymethyltransferase
MKEIPKSILKFLESTEDDKAMAKSTKAMLVRTFEKLAQNAPQELADVVQPPLAGKAPEKPIDDIQILRALAARDPELASVLALNEIEWQCYLIMIPSMNIAPLEVRAILSSRLTDIYAEGFGVAGRYYTGTGPASVAEELAIERAKQVFGARYAVVQPLSGAPANVSVYMALLKSGLLQYTIDEEGNRTRTANYEANPADRVLALNLADGGHLTHGLSLNFSGKFYDFRHYGTDAEGWVDYNQMEKMAAELKPRLILVGASAYPRDYDYARVRKICDSIEPKAYFMVDMAHYVGLVAAGLVKNPLEHGADVVTSTTHKTIAGPRGAIILTNREDIFRLIQTNIFPGLQGGAHFNNIAAIAYMLHRATTPEFKDYQKRIQDNAKVLATELLKLGVTPTTGGTDTHLILVDLRGLGFMTSKGKELTGRQASEALESCGLIINRNAVPRDDKKPWITSGIRMGTPVISARGMGPEEMKQIARLIHTALSNHEKTDVYDQVLGEVLKLTSKFPIRL